MINQDTPKPQGLPERSAIPLRFPQFRNSEALAHVAHIARGLRYVLVSREACAALALEGTAHVGSEA